MAESEIDIAAGKSFALDRCVTTKRSDTVR